MNSKNQFYETLECVFLYIKVEQGFATSGGAIGGNGFGNDYEDTIW